MRLRSRRVRRAGLILVYTAFSLPVTIWMLRNFVAAVPREMEEAAAIDGAGPMRIFWRIMLPLVAPGQVSALTAALRAAAAGDDPVIAIDEEGGDVTRVAFAEGSPYPGNAALGMVDDIALTRAVHHAIGADLAALGINFNLAPCADVLGAADSPAVGTRSFGADTGLVSRHTAAAVAGLQGAGVAACTKHFPGHGRTGTDTHEGIATIEGGLADLRLVD